MRVKCFFRDDRPGKLRDGCWWSDVTQILADEAAHYVPTHHLQIVSWRTIGPIGCSRRHLGLKGIYNFCMIPLHSHHETFYLVSEKDKGNKGRDKNV
jgi:hypothetical protein